MTLILFIDNGRLNLVWEELVLELRKNGRNAAIIYFDNKKYKNAVNNGIKAFYINLRKDLSDKDYNIAKNLILSLEAKYKNYTLYRCIERDRFLKYMPKNRLILLRFAFLFNQIIKNNDIEACFGEITHGIELLAYYLCFYNNITYANPTNTYVFTKPRLTFFDSNNSIKYIKLIAKKRANDQFDCTNEIKERSINDINNNKAAIALRKSISLNKFYAAIKYCTNLFSTDYRNLLYNKRIRLKKEFNKIILKSLKQYLFLDTLPKGKLVLMPLHVQPEATPDIMAYQYSNQLEIARQIVLSLPSNYSLLVKEHPNGLGCRTIFDLKKYTNLPGVFLINPFMKMNDLLKKVDLVVTVGGTAAYEAAIHNIPSIVFSNVYFSELSTINRITDFKSLPGNIKNLLNKKCELDEKDKKLINIIYNGSFNCLIHDPLLIPDVLAKPNIEIMAAAFSFFTDMIQKTSLEN